MRVHQALRVALDRTVAAVQLGMDQVERADVQRGRHRDARTRRDEIVDEVETRLPVIQTAVDMRARDVDQVRRGHHLRGTRDDPHRARDAFAEFAAQHRVVALAQLQHGLLLVTRPAAIGR
ncbi:hypothetical protein FEP89_02137 [Burkholderia multivorans]|nr:hypothetical protein [Burkholderia multivorans]